MTYECHSYRILGSAQLVGTHVAEGVDSTSTHIIESQPRPHGMSSDASDLLSPDEDGMVRALEGALADGRLSPEDIQYVNAHGTGTATNDQAETQAIKRAFGQHARKLAISSNKSMIGHALGAAGGLELVATLMAIKEEYLSLLW
jgi:3-oxoacyl-(acyl-carrier-protein) synthase